MIFPILLGLFAPQTDSLNLIWRNRIDSLRSVAATAKQDTNLVRLYLDIGQAFTYNDVQIAKEYYLKARDLSEKLNWNTGRYMYAFGVCGILYREGLVDSGLVVIRQAYELALKENNEAWIVRTSMNTGSGYFYKNWYEATLRHYQEALHILEKSGTDTDNETLIKLYDNSGVIYRIMGLPDKAIEYDHKALALFGEEEPLLKGTVLYNLATACALIGDEKTEYYFKEALRISELHNNQYLIATIYLGLGNRRLLTDLKEAENYCRKALDIAAKTNNLNYGGLANLTLGLIEMFRVNLPQAEQYCLTSLEMAQQIDYLEYQVNAHRQLAMIYAMKHDFDPCKRSISQADSIERVIAKLETLRAAEEMEAKYETAKKELEIERQQGVIARQSLYRWLLTGGVSLCLVVLALLWYMLRLRTRRNLALAEVNTTKDKFFSIISHDLKNPITSQRDAIQLLVQNARLWDIDSLTDYCDKLLKSSEGHVALIYNLLGWAQLQTGRMTYHPATIILSAFLPDISLIQKMAEGKGITFTTQIAVDALITGDPNMLATVIRNLLGNAVKFTPKGGQISFGAEPSGNGTCIFTVSDTGVGMSREQVRNLFRLESVHSTCGTAGEQGSGLGLIVCRELLEKHGSTLRIESEEGKGSRFWFEIAAC